jgi:hypothetical protein
MSHLYLLMRTLHLSRRFHRFKQLATRLIQLGTWLSISGRRLFLKLAIQRLRL